LPLLSFMALGFLGAVAYVIIWSKNFSDVKTYASFRHIIVGAVIGFVYSYLYTDYSFPNSIMCFVAGYMGPDFIEAIVERMKPKPPGGS